MACQCGFTTSLQSLSFVTALVDLQFSSCACDVPEIPSGVEFVVTDDGEYITADDGSLIVTG